MAAEAAPSVIPAEVAHFDALGDSWWDADGPMAPAAQADAGSRRLGARPHRQAFQARDRCRPAARRPRIARHRLRRRAVRRASGAARRRRHRRRSGAGVDRGRAPPRRGDRRESRLSRRRGRGACGGRDAVRRGQRHGGDRACRRSGALRRFGGLPRQARRPLHRLDAQPHAEELRPRHRRGGIRAALARARNPSLGAVRDAGGILGRRPRGGPQGDGAPGRRLRSAARDVAPVAGHERELSVRREEAAEA